ncbi:type II toxin-antitoxin system RelB/DinJ family antitoxin [Bifidobacterium bifidum]|uniref:type II toxin-antitoxin system RelB/DinJ family antitoxin n=1 Tax=Bifidobacterium bifidum TaxID=1681 RepID=UPI003D08E056
MEGNPVSVPTTTMRIDPELKDEANKVLGELGLSLSGAVTIFLKAVVREQGLPIDMSIKPGKTDESDRQKE